MVKNSFLFGLLNKTWLMIIISLVLFGIGVYASYGGFSESPQFAPGEGDLPYTGNTFSVIATVVLTIFLIFQIFVFLAVRKVFSSLSESNREISQDISSLKDSGNAEIKELVFTRNMLLTKLSDNSSALKKARAKVEKDLSKKV